MVYDESGRSPNVGRGNPTTAKAWDSTKGAFTNPSAYITTSARFNSYGNQYESSDAKGNTTTTTFDGTYQAFPIQVTSPVPSDGTYGSNASFITYSTFDFTTGLPLDTTDINGLKTVITYDSVTLRPMNTKTYYQGNQVGSAAETLYNDVSGNQWVKNRTQIDANKWAESITYFDGLGRAWKTEEIDSNGNIFVEKEFDADGRVSRVTNPFRVGEAKQWTTNIYDEASRIKEVMLPDTAKVYTDYGVSTSGIIGVTKQITDQAGKKRKGFTNALGNMIRVVEDPTGQNLSTDYIFDTLGNLRKTTQGEQSRYFMHDSLGRLLYAKQPEQSTNVSFSATDPITGNTGWSAKYEYDDNSNITKTTDARNIYVAGTYDSFNRIKTRDYSDATPDVSFYYDGRGLGSIPAFSNGKTTKITSSVSETRNTSFDNLGRLLAHQQITDGTTYSTAYSYNLSGALIEQTYPSGRVVKNTLDADGGLAQVQSKKGSNGFFTYADAFSYDSAGAITKMQLGNGKWETFSYNSRQQITQIGLGTTDTTQNLLKLEFSYGTSTQNNGSMREQKVTVPAVGSNPAFMATQTYTYDDLNRIKSAAETVGGSQTWKQTFTIDRYGNRKYDAANTTTIGSCATAVCNPNINTSDNTFTSGQGYSYDANGNVTQDATSQRFNYDAENHQKEFFNASNPGSTPDWTYSYDGDGKRVKKASATEVTVFVYDTGGTLIAEYSSALAQTQEVGYLTTDHLGSPRITTNESGAVTNRKDFMAYGDEAIAAQRVLGPTGNGYTASDVRKDYTGYEKDVESGLQFAQARYYSPTNGRYTSVDPLIASADGNNPQTFNRYSYVVNSPYKFVDPLGLLSVNTIACGMCGNEAYYVDGSAFSGRENPFSKAFASMGLYRAVENALQALETYGAGTGFEKSVIKAALNSILTKGTQEAQRIAADIVNSNIQINVMDNLGTSGQTFVRDATGLSSAIADKGTLTVAKALGYFGINLDRQTSMTNYADLEATLVHEGKHASIAAAVVVSISTGNPKKFQDESIVNDEIRASTSATQFLIKMGGEYAQKGKNLTFINANGSLNKSVMEAKGKNAGENFAKYGITTVQGWLKNSKVTW